MQAEVADLQDRLLRRQAEFENFRRRPDRDRSDFLQYAGMEIVREILPILDDFERALKIECADAEYRKGIELIYQRLEDTLKKIGLEPIETSSGAAFRSQSAPGRGSFRDRRCAGQHHPRRSFSEGTISRGNCCGRPWLGWRSIRQPSARRRILWPKRDYYEVLSCGRDADEQTLKSAYRRLAMEHHPDRNPNNHEAEERFKEAAEAYSVLSDPQKRSAYDRFGHQAVQGAGGVGFDPSQVTDFSDILGEFFGLGDLFGGGGGGVAADRSAARTCATTWRSISKTRSSERRSRFRRRASKPASIAKGKGAEPGSGTTTCPTCRGRGEVLYQQSFLSIRRTCGQCNGAGEIIKKRCTVCHGEGYHQVERKLKVNIPAGVDNGTRLRLSNEGQPGPNGGPPGDLYVILKVRDHPIFDRHGNDLHCKIPVNVAQAALGAELQMPTLDGAETVKVPGRNADRRAVSHSRQRRAPCQRTRPRRSVRPYRREGSRPS